MKKIFLTPPLSSWKIRSSQFYRTNLLTESIEQMRCNECVINLDVDHRRKYSRHNSDFHKHNVKEKVVIFSDDRITKTHREVKYNEVHLNCLFHLKKRLFARFSFYIGDVCWSVHANVKIYSKRKTESTRRKL